MRGLFTVLLFIIFFLAFPVAVLTFSLRPLLTADYLKERLAESKVYTAVSETLPKFISSLGDERGGVPAAQQKLIVKVVTKEVTDKYLQSKTETIIEDSFAYITGESTALPTITFTELQSKVKAAFGKTSVPADLNKLLSQPVKISPGGPLDKLKDVYTYSQQALLYTSVISGIALLGIIVLAQGIKSKLRQVALALFLSSLLGLSVSVGLGFLGTVATGLGTGALQDSEGFNAFVEPIRTMLETLSLDVFKAAAIPFAIILGIAVVLFILSFFFKDYAIKAPSGRLEPQIIR